MKSIYLAVTIALIAMVTTGCGTTIEPLNPTAAPYATDTGASSGRTWVKGYYSGSSWVRGHFS